MSHILQLLKKEKKLTDHAIQSLENYMREWNEDGYHSVLDCNLITETEIADILSKELRIDRVYHLSAQMIEGPALQALPFSKAVEFCSIPIRFLGQNSEKIEIAIADPTNGQVVSDIELLTGKKAVLVVTELKSIKNVIHEVYPIEQQIPSLMAQNKG